jgi:hypothetical protein
MEMLLGSHPGRGFDSHHLHDTLSLPVSPPQCPPYAPQNIELGLTVGTELVVRRRVGLGRVLEVEFRQLRVGMRLSEAACIYVRRC